MQVRLAVFAKEIDGSTTFDFEEAVGTCSSVIDFFVGLSLVEVSVPLVCLLPALLAAFRK